MSGEKVVRTGPVPGIWRFNLVRFGLEDQKIRLGWVGLGCE